MLQKSPAQATDILDWFSGEEKPNRPVTDISVRLTKTAAAKTS